MNDDGLLQEIEADLSRKRMEALWKEYGPTVIGTAIAMVVMTAAYVGWQNYKTSEAQSLTKDYVEIIQKETEKPEEKVKKLEEYATQHDGKAQAALSQLQAASLLLKEDKKKEALAIYEQLSADVSADVFFRQLGSLLVVQTQLDDGDAAALEQRLQPLMQQDSAWRYSAYEYAGFLALRENNKEKAKKLFQELKALPAVPKDFTSRADDIISWIEGGA